MRAVKLKVDWMNEGTFKFHLWIKIQESDYQGLKRQVPHALIENSKGQLSQHKWSDLEFIDINTQDEAAGK